LQAGDDVAGSRFTESCWVREGPDGARPRHFDIKRLAETRIERKETEEQTGVMP